VSFSGTNQSSEDLIQLSHDASLSSIPLLITFLKAYGRPFLGINGGTSGVDPIPEADELVDKEVRERFRRMCEGYYENVAKILVKDHNVR
jgi:regulator of nonsense transcripts 2